MSAHDCAAAITHEYADGGLNRLDTLSLHKLTYLCQGWALALTGAPIFTDPITAGANGPHIPVLAEADPGRVTVQDWEFGNRHQLTTEHRQVVNAVVHSYGAKSGWALARLTQEHDPWLDTWEAFQADPENDRTITVEAMRDYFTANAEASRRRHERRARLARIKATDTVEGAR